MSEKLRTVTSGPPAPVFGGAYSQYRTGMYAAWPASSTETEVPYTEGTINIDMVDRVSRQRVWEGSAVGVVTANSTAAMRPGIDATVANILAKFPVVARR